MTSTHDAMDLKNKSILIVDDSPVARIQIIEAFRKTTLFNHFGEACGVLEGFKAALSHPYDVVICDLEMPGMDGFKFLSMMSSRDELRDIPVIMLTGREDLETKIKGLEQGASDYVTKPFDTGELVARVKVQLKIKSLQDSLKQSNELLRELSNTDPLTGLYNRRFLMETLEKEIRRGERSGSPMAMVMADIDHFKAINDTFGHQQGDEILKKVAELLLKHLRQYDCAARFGGEEFALILPQANLAQGVQVAERIRAATGRLTFPPPLEGVRLTISFGVASFPRPRIYTVDDLIREADAALYSAKKDGRDRVCIQ
jgi:two-component system, cell cycle response regulator